METIKKYEILNNELTIENEILMNNLQKIKSDCEQTKKLNIELEYKNIELKNSNEFLKKEYEELRNEMDKIKYSRSYKFINKIKKIVKRG